MGVILLFGQQILVKQQNDINFIQLQYEIRNKMQTRSRIVRCSYK